MTIKLVDLKNTNLEMRTPFFGNGKAGRPAGRPAGPLGVHGGKVYMCSECLWGEVYRGLKNGGKCTLRGPAGRPAGRLKNLVPTWSRLPGMFEKNG